MVNLYLIRHGQQMSKDCNVNVSLSEKGRKQAELLGKRLASYPIDAWYSSNLIRAVETSQIAYEQVKKLRTEPLSFKEQRMEELREIDFGDLTGATIEEQHEFMKQYWSEHVRHEEDLQYPNGETSDEAADRLEKAFEEIIRTGKKEIVVVTHGVAIRAFIAKKFMGDIKRRLDLTQTFENTCINQIGYDETDGSFYLERFNDYAHLEPYEELRRNKW